MNAEFEHIKEQRNSDSKDYKHKYQKYKNKYLQLQGNLKQSGGVIPSVQLTIIPISENGKNAHY